MTAHFCQSHLGASRCPLRHRRSSTGRTSLRASCAASARITLLCSKCTIYSLSLPFYLLVDVFGAEAHQRRVPQLVPSRQPTCVHNEGLASLFLSLLCFAVNLYISLCVGGRCADGLRRGHRSSSRPSCGTRTLRERRSTVPVPLSLRILSLLPPISLSLCVCVCLRCMCTRTRTRTRYSYVMLLRGGDLDGWDYCRITPPKTVLFYPSNHFLFII
jgi:hypothetical protein